MCLAPTARHSPQSLGQRPRLREIKKTRPALKAPFTSDTSSIPSGWLRRAFSACCWSNQIPGARPQAEADKAPWALNKYSGRAFGVRTSVPAAVQASARRFFQLPTQSDTRTHRSPKALRAKSSAIRIAGTGYLDLQITKILNFSSWLCLTIGSANVRMLPSLD
jgi:hypothetical protein